MNRQVEQALHNLIPRNSGVLPPELIELTRSLLAQSRAVASTLKTEEEIARTYASTLDLPPIEPRPPIPPRSYAKLYSYLDRSLVSGSRRRSRAAPTPNDSNPNTPRKSRIKPIPSTPKSHPTKEKQTPSKAAALDPFRKNRTPKSGLRYASNAERDARIPKWLRPVIRKLCTDLSMKPLIPHVLAGVESILCLPHSIPRKSGRSLDFQIGEKVPALVIAVYFFVCQAAARADYTQEEFGEMKRDLLDRFKDMRRDEGLLARIGEEEGDWKGWEKVDAEDVVVWVKLVNMRGYDQMDWHTNISLAEGDGDSDAAIDEVDIPEGKSATRRGLGKMMHDEYDYLGPEKRAEYKRWEERIKAEIAAMLDDGVEHMDVDPT
ncbi:origin recognition complex, subunit 6 [Amylocarpus encephaloides]|uniref:Origin recognition complex, subunit 6 n=1 Tax=Amylocarpus encephaloides TaxID=45428 RepID=A0A9P7YSU0_9HELO|nr:origin recognition complex, subunit 6 [Amylocarpus encephaloides]